jgi:hypothetical protein
MVVYKKGVRQCGEDSCHVGIRRVATRAKNPRNKDVVDIVISMNNDSMATFAQCFVLMDSERVAIVYQLIVYFTTRIRGRSK